MAWVRYSPINYVTSLPSSPVDGQEIFYAADATNGVIWHLRYRSGSSSSYKWEYLGGPPLFSQVSETANESTTSTTFAALTTAGPSVTLPLAGDYQITLGCRAYGTTDNQSYVMSYDIGASTALDNDGIFFDSPVTNGRQQTITFVKIKTGLSAVALTSKYRVTGGTGYFGRRRMLVTPVRVG